MRKLTWGIIAVALVLFSVGCQSHPFPKAVDIDNMEAQVTKVTICNGTTGEVKEISVATAKELLAPLTEVPIQRQWTLAKTTGFTYYFDLKYASSTTVRITIMGPDRIAVDNTYYILKESLDLTSMHAVLQ